MKTPARVALLPLGIACLIAQAAAGLAQGGTASGKGKTGSGKAGTSASSEQSSGGEGEQKAAAETANVLYQVDPEDKTLFQFDYGPPTSPASQLLGIDTGASPPSTSLTSFVLAIPNILGEEQGQSISLDVAPVALFQRPARFRDTFRDYVGGDTFHRLTYRTRLNIAAINGRDGGNDPANAVRSGLAFGFSASLLDTSDPIVAGRDAMRQPALVRCLTPVVEQARTILVETSDISVEELALQNEREEFVEARQLAESGEFIQARNKIRRFFAPTQTEPAERQAPREGQSHEAPSPADRNQSSEIAEIRRMIDEDTTISVSLRAALTRLLTVVGQDTTDQRAGAGRGGAASANAQRPERAAAQTTPPPSPLDQVNDAGLLEFIREQIVARTPTEVQSEAMSGQAITRAFAARGLTARINLCSEFASRRARFGADLDVGVGLVARGRPGELADLEMEGGAVWLAGRLPLRPTAREWNALEAQWRLPTSALMIAASGRYGWGERLATGDQTMPEFQANTLGAWIGLEYLSPTYRLAGQYGWRRTYARSALGEPFETSGDRFLIQGQVQLGNERSPLWLDVSYGQATGTTDALSDETILVSLRYTPPKPPSIGR